MNEKVVYFKSYIASKYINICGKRNYPFISILCVKLDEIGDLVTALPAFYNLHKNYPEAHITLLCKPYNAVFFKYIDYVDCIHSLDQLPKDNFDLIVDLRGTKETIQYALKNRPKYRLDRGSIRFKNKFFGGQKNEIITNLEVIAPILDKPADPSNSIVLSDHEKITVEKFLRHEGLNKFVILHLGARDEARRWPIERFQSIINYLNERYSLSCLLVGGEEDRAINNACLKGVADKTNQNVVGKFNLLEYAALCSKSSLFIGNESGPLHIAAAQNTPNIALFGPGVKGVFYPMNQVSIVHHYFLARNHTQQTIENSTIRSIRTTEVKQSIDRLIL